MKMIHAARSEFYLSKFKLHKGDSKEVYRLVSRLPGSIMENKLLDNDSNYVICEELANFILNKIARIRQSLSGYELYECETSDYLFQCQISRQWITTLYVRQCQGYTVNHVNWT